MKKLKKILKVIFLSIAICTISVVSYADKEDFTVKMKSKERKYFPGDKVEIVVSIENINTDEGIAACSAILDYDEEIFEDVEVQQIDEWDKPTLMDNMIQITRMDMMNSKENQNIAVISLKIKEDVSVKNAVIGLSKFDATDGNKTIRNTGAYANIKIVPNESSVAKQTQEETINGNLVYIIVGIIVLVIIAFIVLISFKNSKKNNKKTEEQ